MFSRYSMTFWLVCLLVVAVMTGAGEGCYADVEGPPNLSIVVEFDLRSNATRIIAATEGNLLGLVSLTPEVLCLREPVYKSDEQRFGTPMIERLHGVSIRDGKWLWTLNGDRRTYAAHFRDSELDWSRNGFPVATSTSVTQMAADNTAVLLLSERQGDSEVRSIASVNVSSGQVVWKRELNKERVAAQSSALQYPEILDSYVFCSHKYCLDRLTGKESWQRPSYSLLAVDSNSIVGWRRGISRAPRMPDIPGVLWWRAKSGTETNRTGPIDTAEELLGVCNSRLTFITSRSREREIQLVCRDIREPERVVSRSEVIKDVRQSEYAGPIVRGKNKVFFGAEKVVAVDLETGQFLFIRDSGEKELPVAVEGDVLYLVSKSGIVTRNARTGSDAKVIWSHSQIPACTVHSLRSAVPNERYISIDSSQWRSGVYIQPSVVLDEKMYFIVHN